MAKNKRKNKLIFPLALVAVLVIMIVGLVLLKNHNGNEAVETGDVVETVTAFSRKGVIVTKMTFPGKEETLSFSYENENWVYTGDVHFPVDTEAVDLMAENLMKVEAQMKVDTEGADKESFGFGDKAKKVVATYSDGRSVEFEFGIVNSYNGYQYFTYSGTEDVYLVSQSYLSAFEIELTDLYKSESCTLVTDGAEEDGVTSVLISTAGGQQKAITDETGCKKLFSAMSYFNLSIWEDYYADEAEMAEKYGIRRDGDRASISYTLTNYKQDENGEYIPVEVQKSYTVYFGNEFQKVEDEAEGETAKESWRTFYTVEGSDVVYSISSDRVDEVFAYLNYTETPENTEDDEATVS